MTPTPGTRSRRDMVLVVDFGTTFTKAALLVPGDPVPRFVPDPRGGRVWPSCVYLGAEGVEIGEHAAARFRLQPLRTVTEFKRDLGRQRTFGPADRQLPAWELTRELLAAVRNAAQQMVPELVDRLLITCPGDYTIGATEDGRWADLDRACREAGFLDIEYLHEPVAAAYAPVTEGPLVADQVVLVYDFGGGTFDAAVVRIGPRHHEILAAGSEPFCGGADIDALVAEEIRLVTGAGADSGSGRRAARFKLAAMEVKEQLSKADKWPVAATDDDDEDEDRFITLERLEELLVADGAGLVDRTLALVRRLLDDISPVEPDLVLAVGGTTHLRLVQKRLVELGYPVRTAMDRGSAVIDGAIAWARLAIDRQADSDVTAVGQLPLRWPIPDGEATVSSWLAAPGDRVEVGDTIVRVSLPTGELWDLHSHRAGNLEAQHYRKDDPVHSADWLATLRLAPPGLPGEHVRPVLLTEIPGSTTAAALSVDGRYLAGAEGMTVTVYDLTGHFQPRFLRAESTVEQLVFTAADELVAAAGTGFTAWELPGLDEAWTLGIGSTSPRAVSSPDGRFLAASSHSDRVVQFISTRDPAVSHRAELAYASGSYCYAGAWARGRDGEILIPVSNSADVPVQSDWESGPEILPGRNVAAAAIQPGRDLIVSARSDSVTIWVEGKENFNRGQGTSVAAAANVRSLAFNPSGTLVAAGLENGAVEFRRLVDDELTPPAATVYTGKRCFFVAFTPDGYNLVTGNSAGLSVWTLVDTLPSLSQAPS